MLAEKYPLQWPEAYPRKKWPNSSRFGQKSFAKARDEVFRQLSMLLSYQERATIVLSTNITLRLDGLPYANQPQPADKGVAVYFMYNKEQVVLCCDEWNKIEHNMWAIAKTVESIRSIERWGVSDFLKRSFTGFNALPPKQDKKDWWRTLKYDSIPGKESWNWAGVEAQYKSLAKERHPDKPGGSTELFQELNQAFADAKKHFNK